MIAVTAEASASSTVGGVSRPSCAAVRKRTKPELDLSISLSQEVKLVLKRLGVLAAILALLGAGVSN